MKSFPETEITVPAALKVRTAWLFEMNQVPYVQLRVFDDTM